MSDRLLAINCGNTQMLQVTDDYKMSMVEQAMEDGRSVDVVVYMSEYGENRIITVHNLHYAKDGWGVTHIEGLIMEPDGVVRVTLYDNPAEADPLNLR